MTTHPTDRLTDLVDGALADEERDDVLAHLDGCPRCAAQVRAAGMAREALRALPRPVTPEGLGSAAIAEATATAGNVTAMTRRVANPRWYRVATGLSVAAVIAIAIAVALPTLQDTPDTPRDTTFGSAETAQAPFVLEVLAEDFDLDGVRALAEDTAGSTAAAAESLADAAADLSSPLECLATAFEPDPGIPVRLIEARFEGQPAYLGVFLRGPGAGQPADTVEVLVAARPECRAISSTQIDLPE